MSELIKTNKVLLGLLSLCFTLVILSSNAQANVHHNDTPHFNKAMYVTITPITISQTNLTAYGALFNKPLVPLLEVQSIVSSSVKPSNNSHFSLFSIAMQAQDTVQYYLSKVEGLFDQKSHRYMGDFTNSECSNASFIF